MAEQTAGPQDDFLNYALGQGWYAQVPEFLNSINSGRQGRAAAGSGVLGHLTELLTNPGAGPLGMAATAAYGNDLLGATGGKGIDTSAYMSRYDQLLNDMLQYAGGVNATGDDAPYKPAPIDPNQAPAITPGQAAAAPNVAGDWIKAWEAYNPGQQHPGRAAAGLKEGGQVSASGASGASKPKTNKDGSPQIPNPIDRMLERSTTVNKALKSLADVAHMDDDKLLKGMLGGGEIPGYDGGGLVALKGVSDSLGSDEEKMKFWETMQSLGMMQDRLQGSSFDQTKRIFDNYTNEIGGDKELASGRLFAPTLTAEVPDKPTFRDVAGMSPEVIRWLLSFRKDNPHNPADKYFQFEDGGGVTLGGQPHWIVDENGYPVAAITEDGAPENVRGLANGGVEVTPLRPDRFEQYTGQAPGESDIWGRMIARMQVGGAPSVPGAATGQQFMFPDIPNSQVDTSPLPGSNQIPTWGGPAARAPGAGVGYGQGQTPKTIEDLMRISGLTPGANYTEKFARGLGGSLGATNTNLDDLTRALGGGGATRVSSQQFRSMNDSQRQQYTALLAAMGITPGDQQDFMEKTRPDGLG